MPDRIAITHDRETTAEPNMTSDEGNKRCAELRLAMTAALAIVVGANVHAADMALHMDRIGTVDRHVEGLLARMTVEEKFAQRFTTWINYWLLTHVLCGKWRFDSAMVSDCKAVERLADLRHVAAHPCDTAIQTGRAGVDVDMPDGVSLQRFVGAVRANVRQVNCGRPCARRYDGVVVSFWVGPELYDLRRRDTSTVV